MTTLMHCCVDLGALIKRRPDMIGFVRQFAPEACAAPDDWIVAQAVIKQARGMDAWPMCDHHDKAGHCLGHPTTGRMNER